VGRRYLRVGSRRPVSSPDVEHTSFPSAHPSAIMPLAEVYP
jgi:hypothetical protein